MPPCFHRPWRCTAALGTPAATIHRVLPMRPLCPLTRRLGQHWAGARTRLTIASQVRLNTGAVGLKSSGRISRGARAVDAVTATVAGST